MQVNDEIRSRVLARGVGRGAPRRSPSSTASCRCATAGWAKACAGVTTIDEVLRVTRDELL